MNVVHLLIRHLANQEQSPHISNNPQALQVVDNPEGANDDTPNGSSHPPPLSESDILLSGVENIPPAPSATTPALNGSLADTTSSDHQGDLQPNAGSEQNDQIVTEGNDQANPAADQIATPDANPPEANHTESSSEEEEQPYWAKFEEDKSTPTEQELKVIEQQTDEISALDRKYFSSNYQKSNTVLIHVQMIIGRNLRLSHLAILNICLRQRGVSRGP